MDLTYPVTSMFSGAGFNKTLYDVFGVRISRAYLRKQLKNNFYNRLV